MGARGDAGLFKEGELSEAQYIEYLNTRRDIVCAAMVAPVLVKEDRELKDGEISYAEFAERFPEAVTEIASWAYAGCPDIPVKMKGGEESTVDEITSFRDGGEDGAVLVAGSNVQTLRPEAESGAGD